MLRRAAARQAARRGRASAGLARRPAVWLLLVLLLSILFPFGWLGQRWPGFGRWLDAVFADQQAHALGHAGLFAGLALLLLLLFPPLRQQPWRYALWALTVSCAQEGLQLLYKWRAPVYDDGRDLLVDWLACLAIYLAWRLGQRAGCWLRSA